jgi:hypothetical protein
VFGRHKGSAGLIKSPELLFRFMAKKGMLFEAKLVVLSFQLVIVVFGTAGVRSKDEAAAHRHMFVVLPSLGRSTAEVGPMHQ